MRANTSTQIIHNFNKFITLLVLYYGKKMFQPKFVTAMQHVTILTRNRKLTLKIKDFTCGKGV